MADSETITCGCDLHDAKMVLRSAAGAGVVVDSHGRSRRLVDWLRGFARDHGAERIVFAYEDGGRGFIPLGLVECPVEDESVRGPDATDLDERHVLTSDTERE